MNAALIVLRGDDTDDKLLESARRYATGTDTELVVAKFVNESAYQSDVKDASRRGDQAPGIDEVEEEAKADAEAIAADAFDDAVEWAARGSVGELPDEILKLADELDCDHLFITGKHRSPTGKVLFGDLAQSVILRFDGPVTVTTKRE